MIERIRDALKLPILYISHDEAKVRRLADEINLHGRCLSAVMTLQSPV